MYFGETHNENHKHYSGAYIFDSHFAWGDQPFELRIEIYYRNSNKMIKWYSLIISLFWCYNRPYFRQITEWMECNVVTHLPPGVYPKAGNGALRDQWAIKHHCQNYNPTIVVTVRNLVHWKYVISENIPRVSKSWKTLLISVFATFLLCSSDTHSNNVNIAPPPPPTN